MVQLTRRDGAAWPLAFDWRDEVGRSVRVEIDRVLSCVPSAEQKSGAVGDRYECVIDGKTDYLYYSIIQPRKWFRLLSVTREAYEAYYKLPRDENERAKTRDRG
jgi:hypothetical protein